MPTIVIPLAYPTAPSQASTRWRRRVGRELALTVTQGNQWAAYFALRRANRVIEYDESSASHPFIAPASTASARILWPSHDLATNTWFFLRYQANPSPASGNTRIDLTLYDHGAATVIDEPAGSVGIRLDEGEAELEAEREAFIGATFRYPELTTNSGVRTFTPFTYPSLRRPLNVPGANRGNRLRLSFALENVRLLSCFVMDAVLQSVDV